MEEIKEEAAEKIKAPIPADTPEILINTEPQRERIGEIFIIQMILTVGAALLFFAVKLANGAFALKLADRLREISSASPEAFLESIAHRLTGSQAFSGDSLQHIRRKALL